MKTKLSPQEIATVLYSLHADLVDDDVMLWMPVSIEDIADLLTVAIYITSKDE
jgi:hypothetical protein